MIADSAIAIAAASKASWSRVMAAFLGSTLPRPPVKSHADQRLQQTADHPVQFELALHRDQANAILRGVHHDLVIDAAVPEIEIPGTEMPAGMGKTPR